jgi:hypothetical protein
MLEGLDVRADPLPPVDAGGNQSRTDRDARGPFRWAAALAAAVVVVAAVLLDGSVLDDPQKAALSSTLLVVCSLAATLCCLRPVLTTASVRLRRSWLLFAGACAAWTTGSVFWFYYQVVAPPAPYPSGSDLFYLSAFVLAGGGLVTFPIGSRESGDRARLFLDGLAVRGSLLYVSHLLVLRTVFANLGDGLAAAVLAAYPLADVLLGSLAVLLLSRSAARWRLDLVLLGCGLLVYTVAAGTSVLGAALVNGTLGLAFAVGAYVGVENLADVLLGAPLLVLFAVRQTVLTADNHALRQDLEARWRTGPRTWNASRATTGGSWTRSVRGSTGWTPTGGSPSSTRRRRSCSATHRRSSSVAAPTRPSTRSTPIRGAAAATSTTRCGAARSSAGPTRTTSGGTGRRSPWTSPPRRTGPPPRPPAPWSSSATSVRSGPSSG